MPGYPVSSAFVLTTGLALVGILTIGSVPHATAQSATPAAASPSAASGDFAGLVDIGGRSLYLECHGTGSPTVVLVAGGSSSARYWTDDLLHPDAPRTMVMPEVAKFTRVCAYDRPGTYAEINDEIFPSRSDAVAQPRTVSEMVDELHALLQAAEIPGPYVLAGHSWGGFMARFYAATYPDEVIGLVLVDAYTELLEDVMPPEKWQALVRLNQELGSDVVHQIPGYGDAESTGYGANDAAMREAVAASPLPPMPLAVFAHGKPFAAVGSDAQGSPPGSWRGTCWRRTKRRPPWSRTRASPWPARAATTSTRINPSW